MRQSSLSLIGIVALILGANGLGMPETGILLPHVNGDFWQIAGNPDLGRYTTAKQQPVDFAIWQAVDGTWQLWSCIRSTKVPGETRLFYRWQSDNLTDRNWTPKGIAMLADPNVDERPGGLQAPYVFKQGGQYYMFYGTWDHIAVAKSTDGKIFARQLSADKTSSVFPADNEVNPRDPMVLERNHRFYLYYTAYRDNRGADFVRTSADLFHWSESTEVAYGGSAGDGPYSAECPFVYYYKKSGLYYLFRTQRYGINAQTSVYASKNPLDFGLGNDQKLVERLPYAAPEIIDYHGKTYLAVLLSSLNGIQIAEFILTAK